MFPNGSNMTILSAVVKWAKPRTPNIEEASSNPPRSYIFFILTGKKNKMKLASWDLILPAIMLQVLRLNHYTTADDIAQLLLTSDIPFQIT